MLTKMMNWKAALPALLMLGTTPVVAQAQVATGDRTIAEGETVEEVMVIGGDLRVLGEVTGDASVFGGDLILEPGGSIDGDAIVTGGEIIDNGGSIFGEMRTITGSGEDIAREIRAAMEDADVNIDIRRDAREEGRRIRIEADHDRGRGPLSRGFGGLVSTLALGLVFAALGAALVFYGRPYLETVSDTVRGATLRSAATGIAATFLALPGYVVLIVALAVSIVGIPLLLVAIPVYPLALFLGASLGLLAVAHAIGERTSEQSNRPFDMRYKNSYAYLFTGLGMMLTPLVIANLLAMTGFLGFFGGLIKGITYAALWAFSVAGFGAVILSRGGTRRTFVPNAPTADFDTDDLFDDTRGGA